MKTRSKKSVLGLFGHVPWGLSRLKTEPRNQKPFLLVILSTFYGRIFAQSSENSVNHVLKTSVIYI